MVRVAAEMLDFLLAVEHLPTLDAKNFTVALLFDRVQLYYELFPFGRVPLDHLSLLVATALALGYSLKRLPAYFARNLRVFRLEALDALSTSNGLVVYCLATTPTRFDG